MHAQYTQLQIEMVIWHHFWSVKTMWTICTALTLPIHFRNLQSILRFSLAIPLFTRSIWMWLLSTIVAALKSNHAFYHCIHFNDIKRACYHHYAMEIKRCLLFAIDSVQVFVLFVVHYLSKVNWCNWWYIYIVKCALSIVILYMMHCSGNIHWLKMLSLSFCCCLRYLSFK